MQGTSSIAIHAPRDAVYAQVAEFSRHPTWKRGLRVEPDQIDPTRLGSIYTTWGRHPDRRHRNRETVTELREGVLLAFDGVDDRLGVFHHRFELRTAGRSTVVVRSASAELRPRLLRLLRPLVSRTLVPFMLHRDLRALKRDVETRERLVGDSAPALPRGGTGHPPAGSAHPPARP
jgi:hypothetical protein